MYGWEGGGQLPPPAGYVSRAGTLFLRGEFGEVDYCCDSSEPPPLIWVEPNECAAAPATARSVSSARVAAGEALDETASAQAATRTLSDACYLPGQAITVTISLPGSQNPPEGAALVEIPPTGWSIASVTDPRCNATQTVVNCNFIPLPMQDVTFTYEVTPPFGETGVACWDSRSEFNVAGVSDFIAVDCVSPLGSGVCDGLDPNCDGTIVNGFDVSHVAVVERLPLPGQVNNRVDGVGVVTIEFDMPFSAVSIEVVGVNSGPRTDGNLTGNGTTLRSLTFPQPLPDQDRYAVTVRTADCRVARWEFVTLVGDCDGNERVDIFDLAAMRSALRSGTFDPDCDIQEDGRINIFDLAHLRTALRAQAAAP